MTTSDAAVQTTRLTASSSLFYGATILAPMVRVTNLGFRTLCAEYGADVVCSEEVVAAKLCKCRREVVYYDDNDDNGDAGATRQRQAVAEYVVYEPYKQTHKRTVVFATPARDAATAAASSSCSSSRSPRRRAPAVVLQLGAADADMAGAAARLCARDVDGVDLNMGCPKAFSVRNGFGAALMARPARAGAIVRSIHDALVHSAAQQDTSLSCNKPDEEDGSNMTTATRATAAAATVHVSIKTRLCDSVEATVCMLRDVLVAAGHSATTPRVHAITLHARTREQRSERGAPLYDVAAAVRAACARDALFDGVCFVLNGSIASRDDGAAKRRAYGFDGVMLARAALYDPTCFATAARGADDRACGQQQEEHDEAHHMRVLRRLLQHAVRYRTPFAHYKYHLTRMCPCVPVLQPHMTRVQHSVRCYSDCYDWLDVPADTRAQLTRLLLLQQEQQQQHDADNDDEEQGEKEEGQQRNGDDDESGDGVAVACKRHCAEHAR